MGGITRRRALGAGASFLAAPMIARAQARKRRVSMGGLNVLSDVGIFMALEKGYFAEEGLEVEQVTFKAGPQIVPPLASDQIQVSGLSTSPALFNAMARGIAIRIVADKGRVSEGFGWAALVLRPDHAARVRDFSDLKGLKIAVPAKGVSTYTQLLRALELGKLSPSDVDAVDLGFPDMVSALGNKAVDAAMLVEPFVAIAVERKVGVRWKGVEEFMPFEAQNGIIAYSEQFMRDEPEAARGWMTAYVRGTRAYTDALGTAEGRDDVFKVISKYTALNDRILFERTRPIGFDRDARVEARSITFDQDWFLRLGLQEKKSDTSQVIDGTFTTAAAEALAKRGVK